MIDNEHAYRILLQTVDNVPCPVKGTVIDFVDYAGAGFAIRLSRENLTQFSDSQIESIVGWAKERCDLATKLCGKTVVLEKGE